MGETIVLTGARASYPTGFAGSAITTSWRSG
jgi:hypothetical protein